MADLSGYTTIEIDLELPPREDPLLRACLRNLAMFMYYDIQRQLGRPADWCALGHEDRAAWIKWTRNRMEFEAERDALPFERAK